MISGQPSVFRKEKRGTDLHYFIKKSQEKLTIYLRQNEKRLSYPDLFTPLTPPAASPLHWSLKAVCLSEILVALDLDSAITLSRFSLIPSPDAYIKILPQSSYILTTLGQLQFYKSLYITTIPTFSHINPDVQSAKFNKNSDECHARTYIYSDEKRKTPRIILPLILQASYRDDIYSICPTICILSSS